MVMREDDVGVEEKRMGAGKKRRKRKEKKKKEEGERKRREDRPRGRKRDDPPRRCGLGVYLRSREAKQGLTEMV